jgi:hypothetical protein
MGAVGEGEEEDAHLRCARAHRWRDEGEVATASSSAVQEEMRGDATGGRGRRRPSVWMCGEFLTCVGRDWVGSKSNPHFAKYGFWADRRNRPSAGQIPRVGEFWAFFHPKTRLPKRGLRELSSAKGLETSNEKWVCCFLLQTNQRGKKKAGFSFVTSSCTAFDVIDIYKGSVW